jgi:hypothetical protein
MQHLNRFRRPSERCQGLSCLMLDFDFPSTHFGLWPTTSGEVRQVLVPKPKFLPASRFVFAPTSQETVGALSALTVAGAVIMPHREYLRFKKLARTHREPEVFFFPAACAAICLLSVLAWLIDKDLVYVLLSLLTAYVANGQFAIALERREWILLEAGAYPGKWPSAVLEELPKLKWLPKGSAVMVHVLVNSEEPELHSEWDWALLVVHLGFAEWCIASWRPNGPLR